MDCASGWRPHSAQARCQVVKFTDVAEFTGELARDAGLVERRIVRLTQEARAAHRGAFHYLLVHAGAEPADASARGVPR